MIIDWTKGALDQYVFSGWPAVWNWSGVIIPLFPGDATFSRQGPGDATFSRQGPGDVTIAKKQV